MERYTWHDGKIRLRLEGDELARIGLSREALDRFDGEARGRLRAFLLSLQKRELLPPGELEAEIFPGKRAVVLQIAPAAKPVFFLPRTDDMLAAYPAAKKYGAALYRRLDRKGYYLAPGDTRSAEIFREFALPCRVPDGVLKETCRRIL